ncbi:MAG: GGDEF domain-containing protein [Robiginitomaculum sp.]|nr:MAG: GGDEF domain-containing protein [Robiginitomaculum sp.]
MKEIDKHQTPVSTPDLAGAQLRAQTTTRPAKNKAKGLSLSRLAGLEAADMTPDVREAVLRLITEVEKLNSEAGGLRDQIKNLENIADTDPLLPVFNRRAFTRELSRAMAFAQRHDLGGALVYVDLDGFKGVNDEYGHAAGDAVLIHVSKVLNGHIRESDLVGRLGGDEFGILLAAADDAGASAKAAALVELIREQHIDIGSQEICIGASAGVQPFQPELNAEEILDLADQAMYAQKVAKGCAA